jgi:H+/Cl- antiporter ClcA
VRARTIVRAQRVDAAGPRPLKLIVRSLMRTHKRTLLALGIAALITATSFAASIAASYLRFDSFASAFFWPNTLLQSFTPCVPLHTGNRTICEGTPLNDLAFVASFALSELTYSMVVFILLGRRGATSNQRLERP